MYLTLQYSRVKARFARVIIQRLGARQSKILYLERGPVECEIKFSRMELYSNLISVESIHARDMIKEGHTFAVRYLYTVENVILDSLTGIVFSIDGKMIAESSSWPVSHLLLNSIPKPPRANRLKNISSPSPILLPSNGFYHWLIEDLPLFLFISKQLGSFSILEYENSPPYVRSLQPTGNNAIRTPRFVHLDRYTFVSRGGDTEWAHPTDIEILMRTFANLMRAQESGKKIYVSRLNSSRSPVFERELTKLLKTQGWEILSTEGMALDEQIKRLSSAETICGVHGAGLAGMVWLSPGSQVVELSPPNFVPCFSRLSEVCGLHYQMIPFKELKTSSAYDIANEINNALSTPGKNSRHSKKMNSQGEKFQ